MSGSNVSYNLHTLGWSDFQSLCGTVLREILGQTVQQFAKSGDGGRDGAFYGNWSPHGDESLSGSFVVQCKFTAKSDATLQTSELNDEIAKARKLGRAGLARNYILITNASLRATTEASLKAQFESIRGIKHFAAYDGNWLTQQIRENQNLRVLVPRVYGLGDLTEILDERVYEQAKEVLSWLGDELARFVVTDAHSRSVKALRDKRFVFLLGDAGTGKSTIAAALALAAADKWQARVIKVNSPSDFQSHSNPHETCQFFWVDDVFGQLKYERERATLWNQLLPNLGAAIKRGAVAIFTSRRYIYNDAMEDLKEATFPLLKESQVVIDVEKLSEREREQILYNHLRLGNQAHLYRTRLKPFLREVARSSHFLPELARRLGTTWFTKKVFPDKQSVMHYLEHSEDYLKEQFEKLSDRNRAALALVFIKNGSLRAPLSDLSGQDEKALKLFNANLGEVRKALVALDGPYIAKQVHQGDTLYRFKHPTIRDGFGKFIAGDPNLMDCYLQGTTTEMLLQEVTCGDTRQVGDGLVIPSDRFGVVISRLLPLQSESWSMVKLVDFLNSRCSSDFIIAFVSASPSFVRSLQVDSSWYMFWSPTTRLYAKLYACGLLPESCRKRFVLAATTRVVQGQEWRIVKHTEFRKMFRPSELRRLRSETRRNLTATKLREIIDEWKRNWEESKEETPEDYFWGLKSNMDALADEFDTDLRIRERFTSAIGKIDDLVEKLYSAYDKPSGGLEADTYDEPADDRRSVFDDVDA